MLSRTLELSRYVVEGDQEQQFLAKRGAMVEAAKENFPGLMAAAHRRGRQHGVRDGRRRRPALTIRPSMRRAASVRAACDLH
jgi:hypothetical protein